MGINEKAIMIEKELQLIEGTEDQFRDSLQSDWVKTIRDSVSLFKKYGGEIKDEIEIVEQDYLSSKMSLEEIAEEATVELCEHLHKIGIQIEKQN